MALTPQYAAVPRIGAATLTTSDASLTAPTTVGTIIVGASTGTRIEKIGVKAVATTVSGLLRIFLHDGTNYTLIAERVIPPLTPSTTFAAFEEIITSSTSTMLPLHLPNASWSIRATLSVTQTGVRVRAEGADL